MLGELRTGRCKRCIVAIVCTTAALGLASCRAGQRSAAAPSAATQPAEVAGKAEDEPSASLDAFVGYTPVTVTTAPVPARFSAALPVTVDELAKLHAHPPLPIVKFVAEEAKKLKGEARARWLLALAWRKEPEARKLVEAACRAPKVAKDHFCTATWTASDDALSPLERMHAYGESPTRWRRENPEGPRKLMPEVQRCAAADRYRGLTCLSILAAWDWTVARDLSARVEPFEDPWSRELPAGLASFGSRDELVRQLVHWGVIRERDLANRGDAALDAVSVRDVLRVAERSYWFDSESNQFPNEHDVLLGHLARTARPDLDGVVFEEVPPPYRAEPCPHQKDQTCLKMLDAGAPYRVRAYIAGKRYEVKALAMDDWYDLFAVGGLLNVLLRELKSERRILFLDGGGQDATAAAIPVAALSELTERGLLYPLEMGRRPNPEEVERAIQQLRGTQQ